jgi:copper chaperone CopZ
MRLVLAFVLWLTPLLGATATAPAVARTAAEQRESRESTRTTVLEIEGMQCDGCAKVIHSALAKTKGVKKVSVSRAKKEATVTFDPRETSVAKLIDAIENAQGMAPYKARERK